MATLEQLANRVDGKVSGDASLKIRGAGTLQSAGPGEITFLTSARFTDQLATSNAAAVVVPEGFRPPNDIPFIEVADVAESFVTIVKSLRPPLRRQRIGCSAKAFVSASAQLGEDVSVHPGAYIGDQVSIGGGSTVFPNVTILERCQIGKNVTIYPNAVLYEDTVVNDNCIIHAGCVLGGYGFGYDSTDQGHQLGQQLGFVEIGDSVELGCNTTVDRGSYGATRIGAGTKIDNQVQIGHNCQVGSHNLICSQVGIAGSSQTGSFVVLAGQVGIGDHLEIGDFVTLGAQAGVMHNVKSGETLVGSPAMPVRKQMQIWAVQSRLPEIRTSLKTINKKLEEMEENMLPEAAEKPVNRVA